MWPFGRDHDAGQAAPKTIDVHEAFARTRRGARFIDVRSEREFAAAHPKGARNLSPAVLRNGSGLRPQDEIVLICASGHRSLREARRLAENGYANVFNVGGGLHAWRRAGLPTKARRR
jgi:rhodanese-related sulfurtransferase